MTTQRKYQEEALAAIERLRQAHRPFAIYGECDHDHDGVDADGVVYVEEIGFTCEKEYDVCFTCCTDDDGQNHWCAEMHVHGPGRPICQVAAMLPPPPETQPRFQAESEKGEVTE